MWEEIGDKKKDFQGKILSFPGSKGILERG
jgi:hypothetical protein